MTEFMKTIQLKGCISCKIAGGRKSLLIKSDSELAELLPYIHSVVLNSTYNKEKGFVTYKRGEELITIHGDGRITIAMVKEDEIEDALGAVKELIRRVDERKDTIEIRKNPVTTLALYNQLPKTNCKECGLPTCMAFAMAVFGGQRGLEECPKLIEKSR